MSGSPNTTKRLPAPVALSASAMWSSLFMRAFNTVSRPKRASASSLTRGSKAKPQMISVSNRSTASRAASRTRP